MWEQNRFASTTHLAVLAKMTHFFPKRVGEKKMVAEQSALLEKHNNNDYNSLLASWLGLEPLKRNLCMNSLTNARCINQISGKKKYIIYH